MKFRILRNGHGKYILQQRSLGLYWKTLSMARYSYRSTPTSLYQTKDDAVKDMLSLIMHEVRQYRENRKTASRVVVGTYSTNIAQLADMSDDAIVNLLVGSDQ